MSDGFPRILDQRCHHSLGQDPRNTYSRQFRSKASPSTIYEKHSNGCLDATPASGVGVPAKQLRRMSPCGYKRTLYRSSPDAPSSYERCAVIRMDFAKWTRKGMSSATAKPSEKKHFGSPLSVFGQVPWPRSSRPDPVAASAKIGSQASRNTHGFHRRR